MIQRPRVLIVDNDSAFRETLYEMLRRDCLVSCAPGGMDGFTIASMHHPDVILSEFHTPGWTGLRLLAELRQHRILSQTPFLFVTSEDRREAIEKAISAGASDYILKSAISRPVLLHRIAKARTRQTATANR